MKKLLSLILGFIFLQNVCFAGVSFLYINGSNNNDEKLSAITNEIISLNKQIKDANLALNGNDKQPGLYQSLAELKEQKEKKSEEIASYKAAEIMQKRTLTISSELISLDNQIAKKRKEIFEKFSSKSYDFFAKKLKEILILCKDIDYNVKSGNLDLISGIYNLVFTILI